MDLSGSVDMQICSCFVDFLSYKSCLLYHLSYHFLSNQTEKYYVIQKLIGSPDDSSLGFLRSNHARRYVKQLPQYPKQQFSARFPNMSPAATDLLEKMLVFDPNKRITGIVCNHLECPVINTYSFLINWLLF